MCINVYVCVTMLVLFSIVNQWENVECGSTHQHNKVYTKVGKSFATDRQITLNLNLL